MTPKWFRAARVVAIALTIFLAISGSANADMMVLSPTADSYTNTSKATANYGRDKTLLSRYDADDNGRNAIFLKFDVSAIPRGSSISEATLKIYLKEMTGLKATNLGVYRATSDWSETSIHSQNKPTGPGPLTTNTFVTNPGYKSFDVTELFTGWLGGTFPNYGLFLANQGKKEFVAEFNSRDALGSQPQLLIYYIPPSGGKSITGGMPMASGREPLVSDVKAVKIESDNATITWTTDGMTTSKVRYGLSAAYDQITSDSDETTNHSIVIPGLKPGKIYHFRVYGRNKAGLEAMSADFKFDTPKAKQQPQTEKDNKWGWLKLVGMALGILILLVVSVILVFEFPRWRRGEVNVADVMRSYPAILRAKIRGSRSKRK